MSSDTNSVPQSYARVSSSDPDTYTRIFHEASADSEEDTPSDAISVDPDSGNQAVDAPSVPQECSTRASSKESIEEQPEDNAVIDSATLRTFIDGGSATQPQLLVWWRRIGLTGCLLLIPGSLLTIAVLSVLAKVWHEASSAASARQVGWPWIYLLSSNRATSLVTICSAAVRTISTLQAGVMTAMLASFILEQVGTSVLDAPLLSILRAVGSSPTSLVPAMAMKPRSMTLFMVQLLLVVEIMTILAVQFSSTILISDFTNANITSDATEIPVHFGAGHTLLWNSYWAFPVIGYTFAEHPGTRVRGADYDDTGHTYRAFLPFSDEAQRTSLRRFSGLALVTDHQVVCTSPVITNLELVTGAQEGYLTGNLENVPQHSSSFLENGGLGSVGFACKLSPQGLPAYDERPSNVVDLCLLKEGTWNGLLKDTLVPPPFPTVLPSPSSSSSGLTFSFQGVGPGSSMILSIQMLISTPDEWEDVFGDLGDPAPSRLSLDSLLHDGPWTSAGTNESGQLLRISSCMTNLGMDVYNVSMERLENGFESAMDWDSNRSIHKTEEARMQLGVSSPKRTPEDRGLLRLSHPNDWGGKVSLEEDPKSPAENTFRWRFQMSLHTSKMTDGMSKDNLILAEDVLLPVYRGSNFYIPSQHPSINDALAALYEDILVETESPALALQAILTKIGHMFYYTTLPRETSLENVTVAFSATTFIPTRQRGLISVSCILATHLLLVFFITIGFARLTGASFVGNSWQAVAQVVSNETAPVLERAAEMTDKDVQKWMKEEDIRRKSSAIVRRRPNGRVELSVESDCILDVEVSQDVAH